MTRNREETGEKWGQRDSGRETGLQRSPGGEDEEVWQRVKAVLGWQENAGLNGTWAFPPRHGRF